MLLPDLLFKYKALNTKEDLIRTIDIIKNHRLYNVVYKEEKKNFCTGKNCILIDDYSRNIKEWESSGGTGILFTGAEETIHVLREMGVLD